jgi:hypothetical protein
MFESDKRSSLCWSINRTKKKFYYIGYRRLAVFLETAVKSFCRSLKVSIRIFGMIVKPENLEAGKRDRRLAR